VERVFDKSSTQVVTDSRSDRPLTSAEANPATVVALRELVEIQDNSGARAVVSDENYLEEIFQMVKGKRRISR
jgi:hypothetical protein